MYYQRNKDNLKRRLWRYLFVEKSIYSLLFITVAIIFLISIYASAIVNIVHNVRNIQSYSSLVFTILIMINAIPFFAFILDAIYSENEFQLGLVLLVSVVTCIVSFLSVGRSVFVNLNEVGVEFTIHRVLMVTTCIIGIISIIIFLALSVPVARSFGWKIFQNVGTRPDYIKRYKTFLWWDTVARADIIAVITVLILSIAFNGLETMTWPTTILLPILVLATIFAYVFVKRVGIYRETYIVLFSFIIFSLIVPSYLSFKMIMLGTSRGKSYGIPSWFSGEDWSIDGPFTIVTVVFALIVSFILRIALCILSIFVLLNFKQGMKSVFLNNQRTSTFNLLQAEDN